uniref:Tetratricopeptide repeat domain 8 n=1 Tax=Bos mutus grunniens TaxID=30521 RepID=A0A8B9WQP1_BOSMU
SGRAGQLLLEDQFPGRFWHWRRTRVRLLRNRGSSGRVEDPSRGVSVNACPFGRGTGLETNEVGRLFKGAQFLEPRLGKPQRRVPPAARSSDPVLGREAGRRSGEVPAAERCWAGPDAAARALRPPGSRPEPPRPPARALRLPGRPGPGPAPPRLPPARAPRSPARPHQPPHPAPPTGPAPRTRPGPWPRPRPRPRAPPAGAPAADMEPLLLAWSYFRRRRFQLCADLCTQMLEKSPCDQAAWILKARALTEMVYVDEIDVDEEGIAEMILDENAIAQVPRPGTSLKLPGTNQTGGPSPAVRPVTQAGRPITGFLRPSTQSGRPGTIEQAIKTPRTAYTARPIASSSGRFVRLGTVSSGSCTIALDDQSNLCNVASFSTLL